MTVLVSPSGDLDKVGALLGLTAAGCFALAGVLASAFFPSSSLSGTQLTVAQLFLSGILLVAVTPSMDTSLPPPGAGPVAALLALGILAAGLGNVLFWRVLRQAGPVVAATTYQMETVVAVIAGIVVLDEPFGTAEIIGTALVFAGLAAVLPLQSRAAPMPERSGGAPAPLGPSHAHHSATPNARRLSPHLIELRCLVSEDSGGIIVLSQPVGFSKRNLTAESKSVVIDALSAQGRASHAGRQTFTSKPRSMSHAAFPPRGAFRRA